MVGRLVAGDRRTAARMISLVENRSPQASELMKLVYPHAGRAEVIGLTGSGGSGKSSLIDRLLTGFRGQGRRVGVVAVDPSSPFSGGAILGDRIRFQRHAEDEGVFIRSMGSRGYLGGLNRAANDVVRIMEAMGNDVVLVETLGAGQDEIEIINLAQTCLLVVTPGMGDDIQAMKAGIMEIAHIIVLNKSDLDGSGSTLRSLEATLGLSHGRDQGGWRTKVVPTVAASPGTDEIKGIEELLAAIADHQTLLRESRELERVQAARVEQELGLVLKDELERLVYKGLKGTGKKKAYITSILQGKADPYSVVEEVIQNLVK
jgi:LAO/AO transport system kinase